MTSDLSKEAAELVKQGRDALRPTAADKARVLAALKGQLPPPQPAPTATGGGLGGAGGGGKALLWATGAVVAVASVVAFSRSRDTAPAVTEAPVAAPQEAPAVTAPSISSVVPLVPPAVPTEAPAADEVAPTPSVSPPAAGRGPAGDRLGEEVALLTRAQREYHAGRLSAALASVNEHQRKFARGALGQERVRLRVKILCRLGRTTEAKKEHLKLERLAPGQTVAGDVCGK